MLRMLKMKTKVMLSDLKDWAWSRPTYDNPMWDKVDAVIDNGMESLMQTKAMEKFAGSVDASIAYAEKKANSIGLK